MILSLAFTQTFCSYEESKGTAVVTIDTGLGKSRALSRAEAPSNIASISLTITGRYMSDIFEEIDVNTGVKELEVPAGKSRTFEINAVVMSKNRKIIGDLVILRDVTEHKNHEKKLEELDETVNAFLEKYKIKPYSHENNHQNKPQRSGFHPG